MKSKKNLVLIGMMGSGKTTIGRLISKKLKYRFFDIDEIIEKETKMKVIEIFQNKGEVFFRNLEEKIAKKTLNLNNVVISFGGGAFINEEIRKETILKSETFWLDWKSKTLINRIKKSKKRPLAINSTDNDLENLINKRSKYYSMANFKISCENLTKSEITDKILKLYENIRYKN